MLTREETFFLRTIEDLKKKIDNVDPYEVLGASALIRKLFLDSYPLVDQINKKYRVKLQFEVCLPTELPTSIPKPTVYSIQDGIDPETSRPGKATSKLNRDQFFNINVLGINDKEYSIKDIILFEANVMGGVHAGISKTEKEKILEKLNNQIAVGGYASSLRQLKAIGRIILKTLKPLIDKLSI